jgi:predicted porin
MKKLLLGSTALIAASALAVSPAAAEDPISIGVGGYYNSAVSITDQDTSGVDYQNVTVRQEGEIHFTGSTTLDNGLTIGVNVQLEAWEATTDTIDEHFVYFSGDWGRVNIGAENGAAYLMGYNAPAAGIGVNSPTIIPFAAVGSAAQDNLMNTLSDNNKLTYFSPRFSGFQLGVSYTPNTSRGGGNTQTTGLATDNDEDDQSNIVSLGANFVESFNGVDIAVSGGIDIGDLEADTDNSNDDLQEWLFGVNVGFSGFTVGGSYGESNRGLSGNNDDTGWDIGATYATGPWGIGVTYFHSERELGATPGEDSIDAIELGANYALGPGIKIVGALSYREEDNDSAAADTDGFAATIMSKLSF